MSNQHALVVDDSKVGRLTMMKKLEAAGIQVDLVESGQEALDYLAQKRPDMIFMDHMMPGMDGFETTQRIKSSPTTQDIPVIIISGNDDEAFVKQARAIGALNAISKPPPPGVLEEILSSLPAFSSAPTPAAVAQPMPAATPEPAPAQADVGRQVERMLADAMEELRNELLADAQIRIDTELSTVRGTMQALQKQMDQSNATLEDLQRGVADTAGLREQSDTMADRFSALESRLAESQPAIEALQAQMDQRLSDRLAEVLAGMEQQQQIVQTRQQELATRMEENLSQHEQRTTGLFSSLDSLTDQLRQLTEEVQTTRGGYDQRFHTLDERLVAMEHVEPATVAIPEPQPDLDTILAAMESQLAPRLQEMRDAIEARTTEPPLLTAEVADQGMMGSMGMDSTMEADSEVVPSGITAEQLDALLVALDGQRGQIEALEESQATLRSELAALQERPVTSQVMEMAADVGGDVITEAITTEEASVEEVSTEAATTEAEMTESATVEAISESAPQGESSVEGEEQPSLMELSQLEPPPSEATLATTPSAPAQSSGSDALQAEVLVLKGQVKKLTMALVVGGAILLVAVLGLGLLR